MPQHEPHAAGPPGRPSAPTPSRRVRVVGPEGAGKTHLAGRTAELLRVPLVEVDSLVRRPGGGVATPEQFRAACGRALAEAPDGWVVDGDDAHEVGLRYADADVVLWVDAPLRRTVWILLARVVRPRAGWRRGAEARVLGWAVRHHAGDRRRWAALAARDPERWLRLTPRAAATWVPEPGERVRVQPRRVRVLGTSGTGKTTFAAAVARRLGLPHLELDAVFHRAGWQPASDEEFRAAVSAFVASAPDGWVVDGNYQARIGPLLDDADVVVWLDYPRRVVMGRVVRRTVVRAVTRRELWNGNREPWTGMFRRRPEDNIVLWAWRTHAERRRRFALLRGPHWVHLTSPGAADRWLDTLPP
ncbi:AAA family ATPase [Actinotalea solisilvae]|uniref:AAA family ATPase n=1 Tax=Actinotalea solisilvae TaxID=2072922 RepID=UPI001F3AF5E1|nr:AAA family ATPase [Actinotalea solisilvae]